MPVFAALLVVLALVAAVTAGGVVLRARSGRVRRVDVSTTVVDAATLGADALGAQATLVQFSTEFCARCPQVRRKLSGIAATHPGVTHVDVDLTNRPALAKRFHVLQTPTTLIVDAGGVVRSRIGGVPTPGTVERELDAMTREAAHV